MQIYYASEQLTDLFGPEVKPVNYGVYRTVNEDVKFADSCYQYWNGYFWGLCACTPESAADKHSINLASAHQDNHWQGLRQKPDLRS